MDWIDKMPKKVKKSTPRPHPLSYSFSLRSPLCYGRFWDKGYYTYETYPRVNVLEPKNVILLRIFTAEKKA